MREAVIFSEHLSIMLHYLATGNNFEDVKFIQVPSQSIGIVVLEMCLLLGSE
jgi:hypothetical protein